MNRVYAQPESRHRTRGALAALVALGLLLASWHPAEARRKAGRRSSAEAQQPGGEPWPEIPGPKRTVAVAGFTAKSDFLAKYDLADVSGGLAAMLAACLTESGGFIVLERGGLDAVLYEQSLQQSGLTAEGHGPAPGGFLGAQFLIFGTLSEFTEARKARGFHFGVGFGRKRLQLGPQSRTGAVGIDLRVVDATTSEVVASFTVRESVMSRSVDLDLGVGDKTLSHSSFGESPLGRAARRAIEQGVRRLVQEVAGYPWTGSVVDYEAGQLAINAGAAAGIRPGDTFEIYRVVKRLTDPVTGRVLGQRKRRLGIAVVQEVQDRLAFGTFQGVEPPQRGDLVLPRAPGGPTGTASDSLPALSDSRRAPGALRNGEPRRDDPSAGRAR